MKDSTHPERKPGDWLYNNSGALLVALVVFLTQFVFDDMQSKDDKAIHQLADLATEVAKLNAIVEPLVKAFDKAGDDRYTGSMARRDQDRHDRRYERMEMIYTKNHEALTLLKIKVQKLENAILKPP